MMTLLKRIHRGPAARRAGERGMTLLEIMVVITIIGVVMATVTVAILPRLDEAKVETSRQSMMNVQNALKLYYARHSKYPDTSQGFNVLVSEKFLDQAPKDAWGNDFVYLAEGSTYKIISYGSDGAPGGDGAGADISSDQLTQKKQ